MASVASASGRRTLVSHALPVFAALVPPFTQIHDATSVPFITKIMNITSVPFTYKIPPLLLRYPMLRLYLSLPT